ncbi:TDT family transporter [Actinomadura rupiterrae]|uniref:TDT family transporter n=1 Tax=Actinomadura rupiterrae TaxID=559627 RepID=UPI0020A4846B|nr:TDT family transporter [Actinomadura rupiterrae]MCP2339388.1 C4-dicarboxylate transporter/malic acid transport protein [Actinomadura rupiterrae]
MGITVAPPQRIVLGELGRPAEAFRHLGPNWYAAVMGTAIMANGANALPVDVPGLHQAAVAFWALGLVMLLALMAARAVHFVRYRTEARAMLFENPATAVFYGCPPMALLAVGAGTLTVGRGVLGEPAAVTADWILWTAGTVYSLLVAFGIPYLMATRHEIRQGSANPTWLLPVVAPMVAASTGPALIPHLPHGQARETMLYGCYAMFGASLMLTMLLLPVVWHRIAHDKLAPVTLTPTLFLVLGPLGQSTTAAGALGGAAPLAAPEYARAMHVFGVLYGVPVIGFALVWLVLCLAANRRALASGMPFAMTWWAFTFPVGTCVTGASSLARATGLDAMTGVAVALYVLLAIGWLAAGVNTAKGLRTGRLLLPPR